MMNKTEKKANELLTAFENIDINKIPNLRDISIRHDLSTEDNEDRIGLCSSYNNFLRGYNHFYLFVDNIYLYFSKKYIDLRINDAEENNLNIYKGSINEFYALYFQLSTQYDLYSIDFFRRIENFMKYYNWVYKN